jgi:hypothetical protein
MIYMKPIILALLFVGASATPSFSQIKFKLQWLPDSLAWGVFAMPEAGVSSSSYVLVGSGQATVVAPTGTSFVNLKNFSGTWEQNALVPHPVENPEMDYISYGFITAEPPLKIYAGEETLLFTFQNGKQEMPETLSLIAKDDPFNVFPNSVNANPGNDITLMDGRNGAMYYFTGIYDHNAWDPRPERQVPQGPFRKGDEKPKKIEVIRP